MDQQNILKILLKSRVVAIIRKVSIDDIPDTSRALSDGGILCQEITFDHESRDALMNTVASIKLLKSRFEEGVLLGAGTVLTAEQVDMAVEAGAEYIISPNVNFEVIRRTKQLGKISIPGAFSASEIIGAYEAGADIVKIFPAKTLGTEYIKAFKGVIGHIPLFAVGGINADNARQFIEAGASGVGVGGNLVSRAAIKEGNFGKLTGTARELIRNINL